MEENTNDDSRVEMSPYSRVELEADILEFLCLRERQNQPITEVGICLQFKIAKKTLSGILKQMLDKGYLEPYRRGGDVHLTPYGIRAGNEYLYRHHSISQFLQFIGVPEQTANQDACRAEHILADETVQALCEYVNNDHQHYERKIRNTDLTERYAPGNHEGMMQIYTMEQSRPRRFSEENDLYTGTVFLEITNEGWFELEYAGEKFQKTMWYKSADGSEEADWIRAEHGEKGECIPADAFEFVLKANEVLMEGHLLVAYTEDGEKPDMWSSAQMEVELW